MLETETTLYILLLAVYDILLSKYTNQEDLIIGSPIANRRHPDLEHIIGLFANMLAMRNRVEEEKTFVEFLKDVKVNVLEAYENQDYQFEKLVWELGIEANSGKHPLFETVFSLQNFVATQVVSDDSMRSFNINDTPYKLELEKIYYKLLLNVNEGEQEIRMSLEYSVELFKEATIKKMTEHYIEILEQILENRNIKLKNIRISHDLIAAQSEIIQGEGDFRL